MPDADSVLEEDTDNLLKDAMFVPPVYDDMIDFECN